MNRRAFLKAFGIGTAAAVLAPAIQPFELLLPPSGVSLLDDLNAVTMRVIRPQMIADNFFLSSSPLLAYLRSESVPHSGGARIENTFLYGK